MLKYHGEQADVKGRPGKPVEAADWVRYPEVAYHAVRRRVEAQESTREAYERDH
jgi:hypothetical protein